MCQQRLFDANDLLAVGSSMDERAKLNIAFDRVLCEVDNCLVEVVLKPVNIVDP